MKEANSEQFEQLMYVLTERDEPTVIVITCDSTSIREEIYNNLSKSAAQYKFYDLNIVERNVSSLYREFVNNLPDYISKSKPAEYIVNVFGIENSLFTFKDGILKDSPLIAELNFERELFFRDVPFVSIIWMDPYTKNKLKNEAKDLWDWLTFTFDFKDQLAGFDHSRQKISGESVFISYAKEDYNEARQLYKELKQSGHSPWLDTEELNLGANWRQGVKNALVKSSFCIILLSSKSTGNKGYFQKEISAAFEIMDTLPDQIPYIISARLDDCLVSDERLQQIQHIDLFPSFETGVGKLLHSFKHCKNIRQDAVKGAKKQTPITNEQQIAIEKLINKHQTEYDKIKFDKSSKQRLIKEKILLQKLMAQEYIELGRDDKAIDCLRIALALTQNTPGAEYKEEDISFLLNQLYFKPELMTR